MAKPSLRDRQRLANRRPHVSSRLDIDGQAYTASAGVDPTTGAIKEIFLGGAKEGSAMDAILGDAAVVISVALQYGVPLAALGKSVARTAPTNFGSLDGAARSADIPASVIGAALDYLAALQTEIGAAALEREGGN